jgi:hypothetical protein
VSQKKLSFSLPVTRCVHAAQMDQVPGGARIGVAPSGIDGFRSSTFPIVLRSR